MSKFRFDRRITWLTTSREKRNQWPNLGVCLGIRICDILLLFCSLALGHRHCSMVPLLFCFPLFCVLTPRMSPTSEQVNKAI